MWFDKSSVSTSDLLASQWNLLRSKHVNQIEQSNFNLSNHQQQNSFTSNNFYFGGAGFLLSSQKQNQKLNLKCANSWHFFISFISVTASSQTGKLLLVHPSNYHLLRGYLNPNQLAQSFVFDQAKMKKAWDVAFYFLLNLFYVKQQIFYFGRHELRHQILALNWQSWPFSFLAWRSTSSFFFLHPTKHSLKTRLFYKNFTDNTKAVYFIFDTHYHEQTIDHLYSARTFTIAPVNLTFDNWKITYPLPFITSNFFSHYLAFVYILDLQRLAESVHFSNRFESLTRQHSKVIGDCIRVIAKTI